VLKIDLSKAYDRVRWLYIRLLLTHLGFEVPFINWVMSCLSIVSFVVLINGETSRFLNYECVLRHGCPLCPHLFILIEECIRRQIKSERLGGSFVE